MFKLFKDNTIELRVMAVIKSKIAEAQKEFEDLCAKTEAIAEEKIKAITTELETEKAAHADNLVTRILGKIL